MRLLKCIVCFKEMFEEANDCDPAIENDTDSTTTDERCRSLNKHLEVVFLLRKLLDMPRDVCCGFLQDLGDPYSWLNCCDSCSELVKKAKYVFNQVALLQEQYENIKKDIKNTIMTTLQSEMDIANEMNCEFEPNEIVRSSIRKVYSIPSCSSLFEENTESSHYSDIEIKQVSLLPAHSVNYDVDNIGVEQTTVHVLPVDIKIDNGCPFDETDIEYPMILEENNGTDNCELESENKTTSVEEPEPDPLTSSSTSCEELSSTFHPPRIYKRMENQPYVCQLCGNSYKNYSSLKEHERTHTREGLYSCDYCGKSFTKKSILVGHIRTHTKEKPFKCESCGKCFSQTGELNAHKRIHTGIKPFKCEQCGTSFIRSDYLTKHIKSHSEEAPPTRGKTLNKRMGHSMTKCRYCGEGFAESQLLKNHIRTHTEGKQHKCDTCGKSYKYKNSLTAHMVIHTGEKKFKCPHCPKAFTRKSILTSHLNTHWIV